MTTTRGETDQLVLSSTHWEPDAGDVARVTHQAYNRAPSVEELSAELNWPAQKIEGIQPMLRLPAALGDEELEGSNAWIEDGAPALDAHVAQADRPRAR